MASDVESKYLHVYNGFSFLGKDWTRSGDASLPTDVVMKLMIPLFSQGFNVTCDNYFTSLELLLRLTKRQCSLVGTIPANRRKIPDLLKNGCTLHSGHYSNYHFLSVQTVKVFKHSEHPT